MIKNSLNEVNKKFFDLKNAIYLLLPMFVFSLIVFFYNKPLGGICLAITIYVFFALKSYVDKKNKEYLEGIENLDESFSDTVRYSVFGMPFPLVLIKKNGIISWYNTKFKSLFGDKDLLDLEISKIIPEISARSLVSTKKTGIVEVLIGGRNYQFHYNLINAKKKDREDIILLYGVDNTEDELIAKAYMEEAPVVMTVQIDNFDEINQARDDYNKPIFLAEIDKQVNTFAVSYSGFARKYDTDKYLLLFRKIDFDRIVEDKFSIVDKVKESELIDSDNLEPTLSIGIGVGNEPPLELYKLSRLSVDVALGRGGDQIVVNDGENMKFYGGKKKAIEKHNKVKARVMSTALSQLIESSSSVYIMGHKHPDMDSFGSCLGIYHFVKENKKDCKIVLKEVTPPIKSLYTETEKNMPEIIKNIISPKEAVDKFKKTSLVIVLDNHRKMSTEAPELVDLTDQLVLIDHHRRGVDYIEDPTLTYLEPYASSTSELVTELIQYSEEDIKIPKLIADALLAGITVDTKGFNFQTGVRTFEAASLLKRYGADSINVKKLFREDKNTVMTRSMVVSNSKVYKEKIAISTYEEDSDTSMLIAAQAADSMLDMRGVEASFVLTYSGKNVHISGRSVGKISVQLILEKIGGGGHQTSAGVQFEGMTMKRAEEILIGAIDEYLEEDK